MKSQSNPDPSLRNAGAALPPNSAAAPASGYAPTVPMSVYRELSAELQASKAMLDSLNQQNQQLARQNQQFRQEIERLSASALNLQQIAGLPQAGWSAPTRADQEDAMAIADQIRLPVRPPSAQAAAKAAHGKPARAAAVANAAATSSPTSPMNYAPR